MFEEGKKYVRVVFNNAETTEIYTLSLHDALPIYLGPRPRRGGAERGLRQPGPGLHARARHRREQGEQGWGRDRARPSTGDRKSTRLNSSHANITYAVFRLTNTYCFYFLLAY